MARSTWTCPDGRGPDSAASVRGARVPAREGRTVRRMTAVSVAFLLLLMFVMIALRANAG